jgi:hypothetical protein
MIATQISNSNFIDISFSFIASCNLKVFKVSGHGINWHILLLNIGVVEKQVLNYQFGLLYPQTTIY